MAAVRPLLSPKPTGAAWIPFPVKVLVDFDLPLAASGGLDTGNWLVRYAGNLRSVTAATASGSRVTLSIGGPTPDAGPDIVTFSPPPADVIGQNGEPAKEFSGLPLT